SASGGRSCPRAGARPSRARAARRRARPRSTSSPSRASSPRAGTTGTCAPRGGATAAVATPSSRPSRASCPAPPSPASRRGCTRCSPCPAHRTTRRPTPRTWCGRPRGATSRSRTCAATRCGPPHARRPSCSATATSPTPASTRPSRAWPTGCAPPAGRSSASEPLAEQLREGLALHAAEVVGLGAAREPVREVHVAGGGVAQRGQHRVLRDGDRRLVLALLHAEVAREAAAAGEDLDRRTGVAQKALVRGEPHHRVLVAVRLHDGGHVREGGHAPLGLAAGRGVHISEEHGGRACLGGGCEVSRVSRATGNTLVYHVGLV